MNHALLNMKLVKLVECSHCKALCEYDKEQVTCWACAKVVVIDEKTPLTLGFKNTGAAYTPYTSYIKCPNCRNLLKLGTTQCPDCREELTEEYAFASSYLELLKTIACDNARTITSANTPTVVIMLAISVFVFGFSIATGEVGLSYTVPFLSVVPLLMNVLWFYRFGRIPDDDAEYLAAKRGVRQALMYWVLIFAAQVFVLFLLIFPH
jgi:RNA polymerase subunit RPABC4/transcription elongation factor Spt4